MVFLRKNWGTPIRTGQVTIRPDQVREIAAVGSIVLIRGGTLYRDK